MQSRGFQPLRDLPTLIWFLLLVAAAITHRWLPVAGWLMLHLLFLGAATHAILVWSQHFTIALTRGTLTAADRRGQNTRLLLANAGTVLVLVGVPVSVWPVVISGASMLAVAVVWHGIRIVRRLRGALPGRFTRTVRYYAVSAAFLPVGLALGAWLAGGPDATGDAAGRLVLAHAIINVLGWIGITVAGTLVTLWPTMLRTKADDRASVRAARALPVLAGAVVVAAAGAAAGVAALIALGLAAYAVGLGIIAETFVTAARQAPPRSFSTLSAGAALCWWLGLLVVLVVQAAQAAVGQFEGVDPGASVAAVQHAIDWAAPYLAAGFVAQILVAALSYLVPVSLGGGPTPVRVGTAALDASGTLRVATANSALFVCALPVSSTVRVVASGLYLIAMGSFLWFFMVALRRQVRAKRGADQSRNLPGAAPAPGHRGPISFEGTESGGRRAGQAVAGLVAVVLAVSVTYAVDPFPLGPVTAQPGRSADASDSTAQVRTVEVSAADMSFSPNRIEVPVGSRLVIELTNDDDSLVHDLVFANGTGSPRLAPGGTATIDVGVITGDLDGWCSIAGHRQMGMTLEVVATGDAAHGSDEAGAGSGSEGHDHGSASPGEESAASLIDLSRDPGDDFEAYDAVLPDLPPDDGPTTHRLTLPVTEQVMEVAPGVRQRLWTFGGSAPGPLLHGRLGDTFEITLTNDGTIGHSIDFHAGALAPDEPMRTIAPGESLTYTFTATRSGIWMYHCATMPMSAHIANGMYGAVIIEPDDLPEVDRSYALVQGEYYLGPQDGEVDLDRLQAGRPDLVTFNGYASQYAYDPLPAVVGERVRVWILDAGPDRASSFHVIGGQFDTVWAEGRYLIDRASDTGSQALALQPAQGGFIELVFPEAGHYPFVSHIMTDAERGADGIFRVR